MCKLEEKLAAMEERAFCFLDLIGEYLAGNIEEKEVLVPLERHLAECPRCGEEKAALESLGGSALEDEEAGQALEDLPAFAGFEREYRRLSAQEKELPGIAPGQVWSTAGLPRYLAYTLGIEDGPLAYSLDPRPLLVTAVDEESGAVEGFPLNLEDLEFACEFDLILPGDETELGFEFMVETWNPQVADREFLCSFLGRVPEGILKKVTALSLEYSGEAPVEEFSGSLVTGRPLRLENDIRRRFQEVEKRITRYIARPREEKLEFQALREKEANSKILGAMVLYGVVFMHRHKDFLRLAGEENCLHIYSREQPLFSGSFTLKITVNERPGEFLVQLTLLDNRSGEESRGFILDVLEWTGALPGDGDTLKTAFLFLKEKRQGLRHIRAWEEDPGITVPAGSSLVLGIYLPGNPEAIECVPVDLVTR